MQTNPVPAAIDPVAPPNKDVHQLFIVVEAVSIREIPMYWYGEFGAAF